MRDKEKKEKKNKEKKDKEKDRSRRKDRSRSESSDRSERSERKERKERKDRKDREDSKDRKIRVRGRREGKHLRRDTEEISFSAAEAETAERSVSADFSVGDGFDAKVRSDQPILKLVRSRGDSSLMREMVCNISCAAVMFAFISLFCMAADMPELIVYSLTSVVVFMLITTIEAVKPGVFRWIAAGVVAVLLAVSMVIWHGTILGGISIAVNQFYDIAEEAQAYLYTRLAFGDYADYSGCELAAAWVSGLIGLLAALPPLGARRAVGVVIGVLTMFAFAYYGLIPSWIFVAVLLAALVVVVSKGDILSVLPVLLVVMIAFAAVVLVDPGENYGISRMDENFRDRFAFKSSHIESPDSLYNQMDGFNYDDDSEWEDEEDTEESIFDSEYGSYFIIGIIALIVLAIAAILFIIWRNIRKRRAILRKGIDSPDAREAIVAMFPYSVRWIRTFDYETIAAPFPSMLPYIREQWSDDYAKRFMRMYKLWSEAAYSDHEISESKRLDMDNFMNYTIDMVEERCTLRDKLRLKIKHAL